MRHPLQEMIEAALAWDAIDAREGEGANETFERIASEFQKETGYLRPGKDCRLHSPEKRQEKFKEWVDARQLRFRCALAGMIAYRDKVHDGNFDKEPRRVPAA